MIPEFLELLERSKAIHEKKNKDYAAQTNQFENFERSAQIINWFKTDIDKAFISLITTKLARLATLLNSNQEPNNESIDDSFLDLFTYAGLWAAYHKRFPRKEIFISKSQILSDDPNRNYHIFEGDKRIEKELNKPTYKETKI